MAAVAGRREHEPFMLDGEAHLSTTSEGELRIWWFRILKDSIGLRIPERENKGHPSGGKVDHWRVPS